MTPVAGWGLKRRTIWPRAGLNRRTGLTRFVAPSRTGYRVLPPTRNGSKIPGKSSMRFTRGWTVNECGWAKPVGVNWKIPVRGPDEQVEKLSCARVPAFGSLARALRFAQEQIAPQRSNRCTGTAQSSSGIEDKLLGEPFQ